MKKKRARLRLVVGLVFALVAIALLGDFVYSRYVAYRIEQWEASIERDASGVWRGCEAYSLPASLPAERTKPAEAAPPALLFVHGINASPRHYDKMAPALAESGYACRVMRLPGFAKPVPEYARSTHDTWVAAVAEELAALREDHPRVGVVAHSLGGAVAIRQLLNEPGSADFAVLLAPAVAVANNRSPLLSTRDWHTVGNRLMLFTKVFQSPFGMDCHDPAHPDHPGRTPFTPRAIIDELFALMDGNRPRAADLQTPILMVLSQDDVVIDWRAAQSFFDQTPNGANELLMLEDSGHAIPIDYGWDETVDAIQAFDRKLTSAPTTGATRGGAG